MVVFFRVSELKNHGSQDFLGSVPYLTVIALNLQFTFPLFLIFTFATAFNPSGVFSLLN